MLKIGLRPHSKSGILERGTNHRYKICRLVSTFRGDLCRGHQIRNNSATWRAVMINRKHIDHAELLDFGKLLLLLMKRQQIKDLCSARTGTLLEVVNRPTTLFECLVLRMKPIQPSPALPTLLTRPRAAAFHPNSTPDETGHP
jgi:hypothetical protein